MLKNLSRSFFLLCSALTLFYACRKTDTPKAASTPIEKVERFFTVPSGAPSEARVIAAAMEKQNREFKFLSSLTQKAGYPVWDKIKVVHHNLKPNSGKSTADSSGGETVFVPFVLDSQNKTNAVLAVRMNDTDTTYRLLYAKAYRRFGYDTTNGLKWNARDVFHLFTLFDRSIFGHTSFRILDDSLFRLPTGGSPGILTMLPKAQNSATGKTALYAEIEECTDYQACDPVVRAASGIDCTTITVCTTYYVDLGNGSGGSTSGTGDTGGTGGYDGSTDTGSSGTGGGGSDYWNDDGGDPCVMTGGRLAPTDCEAGWEPVPPVEEENWFDLLAPYKIDLSKLDNYPCVQSIISNVIALNNTTIKMISQLYNESVKFNLDFVPDPTLSAAASTSPLPAYQVIPSDGQTMTLAYLNTTIKLNPSIFTTATKLSIAESAIHEMIHAYFMYRRIDAAGNPVKEQLLAEQLSFLEPWDPNNGTADATNSHEQMAKDYVNVIATALKEYKVLTDADLSSWKSDYPGITVDDYYKAMAWGGLTVDPVSGTAITKGWKAFEQNNPEKALMYRKIILAEQNGIANEPTNNAASNDKCN